MRKIHAIAGPLILLLSACGRNEGSSSAGAQVNQKEVGQAKGPLRARADLVASSGNSVGVVTFEAAGDPSCSVEKATEQGGPSGFALPNAVTIEVDLKNLPKVSYRMHIHDGDQREPPDFKTTGRHLASFYSDQNFKVDSDGGHQTNALSNDFSIRSGSNSILSKSLVIHGLPTGKASSQGDAESIVACGIVSLLSRANSR